MLTEWQGKTTILVGRLVSPGGVSGARILDCLVTHRPFSSALRHGRCGSTFTYNSHGKKWYDAFTLCLHPSISQPIDGRGIGSASSGIALGIRQRFLFVDATQVLGRCENKVNFMAALVIPLRCIVFISSVPLFSSWKRFNTIFVGNPRLLTRRV